MAEENINEILGIEEDSSHERKTSRIFDEDPNSQHSVDPNEASNGLKSASNICQTFMWIGIIIAGIGGIVFLANIDDATSGYSFSAKYQARCAAGSACFAYGIVGAIASYIFSKIMIGLSVITKASEKYLSENK